MPSRKSAHRLEISLIKHLLKHPFCLNKQAMPIAKNPGKAAGIKHAEMAKLGRHYSQIAVKAGLHYFQTSKCKQGVSKFQADLHKSNKHNFQLHKPTHKARSEGQKKAIKLGRHTSCRPDIIELQSRTNRIKARRHFPEDDFNRLRLICIGIKNIPKWAWEVFNWHLSTRAKYRNAIQHINNNETYEQFIEGIS